MSHLGQLLLLGAAVTGVILALLIRSRTAKKQTAAQRLRVKAKKKKRAGSRRRRSQLAKKRHAREQRLLREYRPVSPLPERIEEPVNARDVAAYIVATIGAVTSMKLNRLIYLCQAASIAEDGQPLFGDPIHATAGGPVPTTIFKEHAFRSEIADVPDGRIRKLDQRAQHRIGAVLERCGQMNEQRLQEVTCIGPWMKVRSRILNEKGDPEIDVTELGEAWKPFGRRKTA